MNKILYAIAVIEIVCCGFIETVDAQQAKTSYSAIFANADVEWVAEFDLSESALVDFVNDEAAQGFRLESLEIYTDSIGTSSQYAATCVKDNLPWLWQMRFAQERFLAYADSLKTAGYRLVDLEFDEVRKHFASVWLKDGRQWSWVINRTMQEFSDDLDKQEGRPIDLQIYTAENGIDLLHAGVWVENPEKYGKGSILNSDKGGFEGALLIAGFLGLRLINFETFYSNGQIRYSGVLVGDGKRSDVVLANTDKARFQSEIDRLKVANKRPFSFEMALDFTSTTVTAKPEEITGFRLFQNYPNPFNPETSISFEMHEAARVRVEIVNLTGVRVAVLKDAIMPAGLHTLRWNAKDERGQNVPSGIYVLRAEAGQTTQTCKMTVLR